MPVNECIPYYKPGKDVTAKAAAALTGKRLCVISANRTSGPGLSATAEGSVYQVNVCGAGAKAFGVTPYDVASGELHNVIRGGIVPITAGGTVTAGQQVESDATGRVITWGGTVATQPIGICTTGATVGNDAEVALY